MRPWYERRADHYEAERAFWLARDFEQDDLRHGQVAFIGTIEVAVKSPGASARRELFRLRIVYPPGYPYDPPEVEFLEPAVKRSRHQGLAGAPCLFPPAAWDEDVPATEVHRAIEHWLRGYLLGSFPRELPVYELPEYFSPGDFTTFMSADVVPAVDGRRHGRFSVEEVLGHDLAIVRSVDQHDVSRGLLSELSLPRSAKRDRHNGRWFRLEHEPKPVRNLTELRRVLADAGHKYELSGRPRPRHPIGLVFLDEHLGHTQFLMLDIGVKSKTAREPIGKSWPVRAPPLHLLSHAELFRRLEGVRDINLLERQHVAVFGLGAIGSFATVALAREGVGAFGLYDPDTLRPGNVMRHALDLTSVGQSKADAMEVGVGRINPFADTRVDVAHLLNPDVIEAKLSEAALVVSAIGDDVKEELIAEVALNVASRPPVVFARTLHAGDALRVILFRPGRDACIRCLRIYRDEADPGWLHVPRDELADVYDAGCSAPARPGAGLSSEQAAIFAARRALDVLEGGAGDINHWVWVERAIPDGDERLRTAPRLYEMAFAPHPACPHCRGV